MPKNTPNSIELAPLDRSAYPSTIKAPEFTLLCRIAYLTNGGTAPIAYSSSEAMTELKFSRPSLNRALNGLLNVGCINVQIIANVRYVALTSEAKLKTAPLSSAPAPVARATVSAPKAQPKLQPARPPLYTYLKENGYRVPGFTLKNGPTFKNYVDEPLLAPVRENLLKFDLRPLVEASGLKLTPFGKPHSWQFDFTELQDRLKPINMQLDQIVEQFPYFNGYNCNSSHYRHLWREFFIFSMVIELTAGLSDFFICQKEFDPLGDNFLSLWFENQRGPLCACLDACYVSDAGSLPLARRILDNFMPTKSDSILSYALVCVKNEVADLLNREHTALKCFSGFREAFIAYAERQAFLPEARITPVRAPNWLEGVWGYDLKMNLLSHEVIRYTPRITWPFILFRTLVSMTELTDLRDGPSEERNDLAFVVLRRTFTKGRGQVEFERLAQVLAPYFPFFNQVAPMFKTFKDQENAYYGFTL